MINLIQVHTKKVTIEYRMTGLWRLTPLSTIFQLCRGGQFYWWRKRDYQRWHCEQLKQVQAMDNFQKHHQQSYYTSGVDSTKSKDSPLVY
jgi:hypothetical protein